jgi:NAD(P)H-hydrate epimerase
VKATLTQTFIGLKSGLVTAAAKEYCGEMSVDDLGIPATAFQSIISQRSLIPFKQLQQKWLLPRARDAHKGDFGHVLIIGGDLGMAGAVTMTGISALRAGAGLVTIATRHDHIAAVIANCPELMVKGVEDEKQIRPLIEKATVIAIGPGLGQSSWSEKLFNTVMACSQQLVVDADALNLLAKNKRHSSRWILTPHPGEAARLLNTTTQAIQQDRYAAIAALQKQYGGVCVLKGSGTLIADDKNSYVCTAGNPGMAAGGMGDVLTGIIAGLQAQQISPFDAACLAVECHAHAADDAAAEQGERGIMALDLLMHLQTWVNPL